MKTLQKPECESNVKGFPDARYKKFPTRTAAEEFCEQNKHKNAPNRPSKSGSKSAIRPPSQKPKFEKTLVPFECLDRTADGYLLNANRYVVYTDGASSENQRKDSGGSGCGIYWGGEENG